MKSIEISLKSLAVTDNHFEPYFSQFHSYRFSFYHCQSFFNNSKYLKLLITVNQYSIIWNLLKLASITLGEDFLRSKETFLDIRRKNVFKLKIVFMVQRNFLSDHYIINIFIWRCLTLVANEIIIEKHTDILQIH